MYPADVSVSPVGSALPAGLFGEIENVYGAVPPVASSGRPDGSDAVVYAVPARNAPMDAVVMTRPDACEEMVRTKDDVLPMLSVTVKVNGTLLNAPAFTLASTPLELRLRLYGAPVIGGLTPQVYGATPCVATSWMPPE